MSTATLRPATTAQRWFLLGLVLFFVGLSVHYSFKAVKSRSAILRWYEQIQCLEAGDNPYERFNYPNPPIMGLLLSPLTKLPPLAAALTWFYLKVVMTLLALTWVFRLVESAERPFPAWAKGLTILLSLLPISLDLEHGNVNLFILFLVVGALSLFQRNREFLAGMPLALAIACKVTPALFLAYFAWKRAWKTLAGSAVGLVLFLAVIPGAMLGWDQNAADLHSWVERMIVPYAVGGVVTPEHNNQSLPGLLTRMLSHSPSFSAYPDNVYTPVAYHNVLDLDRGVLRWLLKGCMLLFVLLTLWTCRTRTTAQRGWQLAAEFSIVLLGMLLFSERTWKHHCVTLVLPFAVLTYYLAVCRPSPLLRAYLGGSLLAALLLMSSTSTDLLGHAGKLAQVYGAYVWAYLVLLAPLALLLVRHRQAADPASGFAPADDEAGAKPQAGSAAA